MKVTIDIDCTPQEARTFLGLPNVEPMQDHLIQQLQEQLSNYLANTDAEAMLKTWMPESIKGFGQIQEQLWRQFMAGSMGAGGNESDDTKNKG